jgi:hypothetical protein
MGIQTKWLTGNGELGNNGPHQLDICRWALGKQYVSKELKIKE